MFVFSFFMLSYVRCGSKLLNSSKASRVHQFDSVRRATDDINNRVTDDNNTNVEITTKNTGPTPDSSFKPRVAPRPKLRYGFSGHTTWLPSPQGWDAEETDLPFWQTVKSGSKLFVTETKKALTRAKKSFTRDVWRDTAIDHDELKVEWQFKTENDLERWLMTCDAEFKAGFSSHELFLSPRKTALWRGYLDTRVPNDGIPWRAGMCALISKRRYKYYLRREIFEDWHKFTHLVIKFRGDGRRYKITMTTPTMLDITWGDAYQYPLSTHGGPYWQIEKIPFSKFFFVVADRIQDKQEPINTFHVRSISIALCDGIPGPFQFEIDWIGVYYDNSHFEKFAYEEYFTGYSGANS